MQTTTYDLLPNPRAISSAGSKDIYLTVLIGNGQIGGNYVTLNGSLIAKGDLSGLHLLGPLAGISGKPVMVQTNVMDVNNMTDMCVITTTFYNENRAVLYQKIDSGKAPTAGVATFKGIYIIS